MVPSSACDTCLQDDAVLGGRRLLNPQQLLPQLKSRPLYLFLLLQLPAWSLCRAKKDV